jgi:uncharacterized membrane protein YphA (DoxX/SURF4 family)
VFLSALLLVFVLSVFFGRHFSKIIVISTRTLMGLLFIFSGFVKAVDPIGTQYQMQDYFTAYGMDWAQNLSLLVAFLMNCLEMVVGCLLLFNIRIKFTRWIAALMMLMFTCMTLYDAIYNSVPDCGCFGKAITMSNWQTFYKNVIIDSWVVILLLGTKHLKEKLNWAKSFAIAGVFIIAILGFEFYNYSYLPVIDFLDWKKGMEITTSKLVPMFDDQWSEVAEEVVSHDVYIAACYDLEHIRLDKKEALLQLMDDAKAKEVDFIFLTDMKYLADEPMAIENLKNELGRDDLHILYSDDKSIKGLIRSNPGIIQIENRVITNKKCWRKL